MKVYRNIALTLIILLTVVIIFAFGYYKYELKPVNKNNEPVIITITSGSSIGEIAKLLKNNNLIKNESIFKLYCKLNKKNNLKATTYKLSSNMSVPKIIQILEKGNTYNPDEITITFKEGINMRKVVSLIKENTNVTEEDIYNLLKDSEYLDEITQEYWFLTDDIKNNKLYYSLEGYLFPDTYIFLNKDVTVKEIFKKMLDNTSKKLTPYKQNIEKTKLSIHEFITLASIVELEGANSNDRSGVAGVFYNRLNDNWSLGSDVTTFYSLKVDLGARALSYDEYRLCNNYNTRCAKFVGLPVGPIANPGLDSIIATINPTNHDYYYFVADCSKKTYFARTDAENIAKKNALISTGDWCDS